MKRTNILLTLTVFAATLIVSGCAQQPGRAALAVVETQRAGAGARMAPTQFKTLAGRVVAIADGDTLTVLDANKIQHRIRLTGIDAPERRQAFGTRSQQHLADIVFGKQVTVEYDKQDRYMRTLGKVIVEGRDAYLEQIRAGMAWHYKFYENEQPPEDRKTYAEAEMEARAAKRGLWADPRPVPPRDFRRGRGGTTGGDREPGGDATTAPPAPGTDVPHAAEGRPTTPVREPEADTVYITRTGEKYHRLSCQYLRRSRIPVSLSDAKQSYAPCSVCRPPE